MFGLFDKREKKSALDVPFSHRLIQGGEIVEREFGLKEYTADPGQLEIDILAGKGKDAFVRIYADILSFDAKITGDLLTDRQPIVEYRGFLKVPTTDFLLQFERTRTRAENNDLELEQLLLEAGKKTPLLMTGKMNGDYYNHQNLKFVPIIIQLGGYRVPIIPDNTS